MRYTYQLFIAGYSSPQPDETRHANSLARIADILAGEHDNAHRWGAGYEPSEALIWCGELDNVEDIYPDRVATTGPRGGVSISRC